MTVLDVIVMALLRGLAECLPLSASAHLALLAPSAAPTLERMAVVTAANIGIALALVLYFWRDWGLMGLGLWRLAKGRPDAGTRLFGKLAIGSVPCLLALHFAPAWPAFAGTLTATALALLLAGLLLLVTDHLGLTVRRTIHMGLIDATVIGLLQVLSPLPGLSRTGLTITVARLLGYERHEAARFSLLLAVPFFLANAIGALTRLSQQVTLTLSGGVLLAAVLGGLSALLATAGLMSWLRRHGFAPFAWWQIVLGGGMLLWVLTHHA